MIPSKDNPLRPPDWRWQRAQWLRQNGKRAKKAREDDETMLIKRYQTAKSKCQNDIDLERLMYKMPGIFHAEQFHSREDLDLRWEIEARILAREPFKEIAKKVGVNLEVIFWYERTFFNVLEKLDNRSYIGTIAMGRSVHKGLHERDYDLLWKMLGYACGPLMIDSLTSKVTAQLVTKADQLDAAKNTLATSALIDKAVVAAYTAPVSYNHSVILETWRGILELQKEKGEAGGIQSLIVNNINAALTALPFTSATMPGPELPTMKFYEEQAAELRSDELLRLGMTGDHPDLHDAVNVTFPAGVKDGDSTEDQQGN